MFEHREALDTLRDALEFAPDNVVLHKHYAEMLLAHGHSEEAVKQYLSLLEKDSGSQSLRLGLAKSLWANGNYAKCLPIAESFMDEVNFPPEGLILYARNKTYYKEYDAAMHAYKQAIAANRNVADNRLLEQIQNQSARKTGAGEEGAFNPTNDLDTFLFGHLERPALTFQNVGGLEDLKETIRDRIVRPFQNPSLYEIYGREAGGGLLLHGPLGVGKTFIARATAGEINASFISVGINDILDMWVGNSEKRLHDFFAYARKHIPCILFFDELDALAASRERTKNVTMNTIVNQFLMELDGVKYSNSGVLVMGATNALWKIDDAFRRPGRFGDIVFVPPPDLAARVAILRKICSNKPCEGLDFDEIAKKTERYSGADLKGLVDKAVDGLLRDSIREKVTLPLRMQHVLLALKTTRPTTSEWFATAKNFALYANSSGIYDDVKPYL